VSIQWIDETAINCLLSGQQTGFIELYVYLEGYLYVPKPFLIEVYSNSHYFFVCFFFFFPTRSDHRLKNRLQRLQRRDGLRRMSSEPVNSLWMVSQHVDMRSN
jgi:hypothetical protein